VWRNEAATPAVGALHLKIGKNFVAAPMAASL